MKHIFYRMAAIAAIFLSASATQAAIIDFEQPIDSPYAANAPFFASGDEFYQNDYFFSPFSNAPGAWPEDLVGAMIDGSDLAMCFGVLCPINNNSTFYGALNDSALAFGRLDAQSFSVNGFDASFIGAEGATLPPVSGLLRLQGVTSSGASLTETYQLAGPNNAGTLGFSSYQTSPTFASTMFKTVYAFGFACNSLGSCEAFSSDKAQFALDNLSVTAVPEPETTAMFALGLLAMGAAVRRRRQPSV